MAPDIVEVDTPAVSIHFVGDPDVGYEIQLENNDDVDDGEIVELLEEALHKMRAKRPRTEGLW